MLGQNRFNVKHPQGHLFMNAVTILNTQVQWGIHPGLEGLFVWQHENFLAVVHPAVQSPWKFNVPAKQGFNMLHWSGLQCCKNRPPTQGSFKQKAAILWPHPTWISVFFHYCNKIIIWSGKANFKLSEITTDRHNHLLDVTNTNIIAETKLNQPGVSVWGETSSFGVLCPYLQKSVFS
jgi:hypothetical protein